MPRSETGGTAQACARRLLALEQHMTAIATYGGLEALNAATRAELESISHFAELQGHALVAARLTNELELSLSRATASGNNVLIGIPAGLVRLYERVIRPKRAHIRRLADLCRPGISLADFLTVDDYADLSSNGRQITATIAAAVRYWDYTIEEDDARRDAFDFTGAERLVESLWFRPDAWMQAERELAPVLASSSDVQLPKPLRERLGQAYLSYLFGQHLACIALARATLEYALKSCARQVGISTMAVDADDDVGLKDLIDCFGGVDGVREITEEMHYIRRSANEALHGSAAEKVIAFPQGQAIALKCIQNLRVSLSALWRGDAKL